MAHWSRCPWCADDLAYAEISGPGRTMPTKPTWKELLARAEPLLLPCAHDALSARLIERAGFSAYSVGGYALVGARHALPDIGLAGFGEISAGVRDIMAASSLPVLVDCDDGYGDVKNVAHTVAAYDALRRAEIYLKAGADGLFIEAPQSIEELARIGRTFQGVPQLANMLEGGGRTPLLPPDELFGLGFAMVAYPTTLIFRVARTIEKALADLKAGRPATGDDGVGFETFKDITGLEHWAELERRFGGTN